MVSKVERATINQLVNIFGFPEDKSKAAVQAIGDKGDVQMAYNWLLDHGEDDRGGPVEIRICDHMDMVPRSTFVEEESLETYYQFADTCKDGCKDGENWMCLCCGDVRCSRYVKSHNLAHMQETKKDQESKLSVAEAAQGKVAMGHFIAIGLQVWCYECNGYITHPIADALKRKLEALKFGEEPKDVDMDDTEDQAPVQPGDRMQGVGWQEMHGFKGNPDWAAPRVVVACDSEARPGYNTRKAHEYLDDPDVMQEKVTILAQMIKESKAFTAYTGAGISTSSGINDYASKASDSLSKQRKKVRSLDAKPTPAHKVLTQLHFAGYLKHWVQQNHDGLPQKAGFPQQHLNEIHGAWFDPSNPVVPMSGDLRDDLMEKLVEWEHRTDLCLTMGSSLCGMNADRMVTTPATRARRGDAAIHGAVIVSLQQTQHDNIASIRIFGKTDDVMKLLAKELEVPTTSVKLETSLLAKDNIFTLPYNKFGELSKKKTTTLNLNIGKHVRIVNQPEWDKQRRGNTGIVTGKTSSGDYMINFGGITRTLGRWWLIHASRGEVAFVPVVNCLG